MGTRSDWTTLRHPASSPPLGVISVTVPVSLLHSVSSVLQCQCLLSHRRLHSVSSVLQCQCLLSHRRLHSVSSVLQCQDTFVQFADFVCMQLSGDELSRRLPSIDQLTLVYGVPASAAFALSRALYASKISVSHRGAQEINSISKLLVLQM